METMKYTCTPSFIPMRVLLLVSLRSEEVILKRCYILLVFAMETINYTCVPSFTSMRAKFGVKK